MLGLEGAVVDFVAFVGAEAPVFIEAGVDAEVEKVAVFKEGMVLEEAVADGEVEVVDGHEGDAGVDFGEVGVVAKDGELGSEFGANPGEGVPLDVLVEVREVAVELGVVEEGVEVGVGGEPVEGVAVAFGLEAVVDAEPDDVPVAKAVDGGVVIDVERAGAGGEGEAVDAFEFGLRCHRRRRRSN